MASESKVRACPSCEAVDSFETTKTGANELRLCVECGFLDSDARGPLVDSRGSGSSAQCDYNPVNPGDCEMRYIPRVGITRTISKNQYKKKQPIIEAVGLLGLPSNVKTAALELFDRVAPYFPNSKSIATMSLGCLFVAANRDGGNAGRHVPLRDFCRRVHCDKYAIAKAKRWILANKFEEADDPEKMAEATVSLRLRGRDIPIAYERKILRLMSLIRKGWVSSGRVEELFIWPCMFILGDSEVEGCWQPIPEGASNRDGILKKSTFKKLTRVQFYHHYRLKEYQCKTSFNKCVQEVNFFLLSLTRYVPWLPSQQRDTKEGVLKSLDWILENDEWCREMIERSNGDGGAGDPAGGGGYDDRNKSDFLPRSFKNATQSGEPGIPLDSSEKIHVVPCEEELGEEDIKDEDMHLFLRSQEEVENITKLIEAQPNDA